VLRWGAVADGQPAVTLNQADDPADSSDFGTAINHRLKPHFVRSIFDRCRTDATEGRGGNGQVRSQRPSGISMASGSINVLLNRGSSARWLRQPLRQPREGTRGAAAG
jgi:hypothetical protein